MQALQRTLAAGAKEFGSNVLQEAGSLVRGGEEGEATGGACAY